MVTFEGVVQTMGADGTARIYKLCHGGGVSWTDGFSVPANGFVLGERVTVTVTPVKVETEPF